jgi:hypothetical protein
VHPDVRRMLLTQKAIAEGSRALLYDLAQLGDIVDRADEERAKEADDLMALLTPIAKAFVTEAGYEAANHGVQIYGGHGFIREWGMEQIVRDARIAMLYEGTTGIQALDLLGRKVLGSGGKLLMGFTELMGKLHRCPRRRGYADFMKPLAKYKDEWLTMSLQIGEKAMRTRRGRRCCGRLPDVLGLRRAGVLLGADGRGGAGQDRRRRGRHVSTRPSCTRRASTSSACCRAPRRTRRRCCPAPTT